MEGITGLSLAFGDRSFVESDDVVRALDVRFFLVSATGVLLSLLRNFSTALGGGATLALLFRLELSLFCLSIAIRLFPYFVGIEIIRRGRMVLEAPAPLAAGRSPGAVAWVGIDGGGACCATIFAALTHSS